MQAVEGYWEKGRFYNIGKVKHKPGRLRAILTVLDEPPRFSVVADKPQPEGISSDELQSRLDWLKRLDDAFENSKDEELPDFPPRLPMREPHGLTD